MASTTRFISIAALIVLLLSSSCSDASTNVGTAKSTDLPATSLATLPSPTLVSTETPTPLPLPSSKTKCVSEPSKSINLALDGVIVLERAGGGAFDIYPFYLFDAKTKSKIKTINDNNQIIVSPDRKLLAYTHYGSTEEKELIGILNSKGDSLADFDLFFDGYRWSHFTWQNSQELRITTTINENKVVARLLNPFTKTHNILNADWPDIHNSVPPYDENGPHWEFDYYVYGANIFYDPTLSRVLYPKDNEIVSLIDVNTKAEVANGHFTNWGKLPSWSPNGDYLTIVSREENADEFYFLSKNDREFHQITNFSKEFGFASIPTYTWSPSGNQIAFWLNLKSDGNVAGTESELAILDIPSRQVTRLCIQGISAFTIDPIEMTYPDPTWSPDEKYIMITQWDKVESPDKYNVLIVDSTNGNIENFGENLQPIGWMTKEQ